METLDTCKGDIELDAGEVETLNPRLSPQVSRYECYDRVFTSLLLALSKAICSQMFTTVPSPLSHDDISSSTALARHTFYALSLPIVSNIKAQQN